MSFLLGILPPNRDLSLVFHCLRKFDIEFHVKPTFGELAPFAEKCTTGQKPDAEVKEEVEEPFPNLAGDAVTFGEDNDNEVEIKEELVTDLPFAVPDPQIPIECHDLVSEEGRDEEGSGSPPNSDSESNKKPATKKRRICRLRKAVNYAMEKESDEESSDEEEESDEGQEHIKKPRHNRRDVDKEEKETEEMDETADQNDSVDDGSGERKCPVDGCTEKFSSSEDLVEHMKKHPKPVLCRICMRSCPKADDLRRHFRKHSGEKPFACDICKKAFSRECNLHVHQRIHTGDRPYECAACEYKAARLGHLEYHKRMHNGEKPYACTVCVERFSHSHHLTAHMRIHTGERPYACDVCGFKIATASNLKKQTHPHGRAALQM